MIAFERYLIEKGYLMFVLNTKTWKFEEPKYFELSTMGNLDHRYFHSSEVDILKKINSGLTISELTDDEQRKVIIVGLRESEKPATLIYPRPNIQVFKGDELFDNQYDNAMSVIHEEFTNDEIFEAMYDENKILKYTY